MKKKRGEGFEGEQEGKQRRKYFPCKGGEKSVAWEEVFKKKKKKKTGGVTEGGPCNLIGRRVRKKLLGGEGKTLVLNSPSLRV